MGVKHDERKGSRADTQRASARILGCGSGLTITVRFEPTTRARPSGKNTKCAKRRGCIAIA